MYIILVKCNDHYFYVTKLFIIIIWSVVYTAKDNTNRNKKYMFIFIRNFFPVQMYSFIQKLNVIEMKLLKIDS